MVVSSICLLGEGRGGKGREKTGPGFFKRQTQRTIKNGNPRTSEAQTEKDSVWRKKGDQTTQ